MKLPNGLSYLVDIDGKVAVSSSAFLKPFFKEGQGGAQDHVTDFQDQGEFHSSSPPLRCSSRLVEKVQKEGKCSSLSCAPALTTPTSSVSSSKCNGSRGSRLRRPRTSSTSQLGGSPSSTSSGLHLPLGPLPSSFVPCSSSPSSSVMASYLTSYGPHLAALPSCCPSQGLPPARSSPLGNPVPPNRSQLHTLIHQGGCGPPRAGPPFLRPISQTVSQTSVPGVPTSPVPWKPLQPSLQPVRRSGLRPGCHSIPLPPPSRL